MRLFSIIRSLTPVLFIVILISLVLSGSRHRATTPFGDLDSATDDAAPQPETIKRGCQLHNNLDPSGNKEESAVRLSALLATVAAQLRRWRERVHDGVSSGPSNSASVPTQVKHFLEESAAHARLGVARFALDRELAALEDGGRAGPSGSPQQQQHEHRGPQMPPPQAEDIGFPEPSTFACRMLPDGFEVCFQ